MTITRRAALTAMAASPLALTSASAQTADRPQGDPNLKELYGEWVNAKAEISRAEAVCLPNDVDRKTMDRLYDKAFDAQDAIAAARCRHEGDVWFKLAVALDSFPDAPDDNILLNLRADAMQMVNLSDKAQQQFSELFLTQGASTC